jgi:hypothetical protein
VRGEEGSDIITLVTVDQDQELGIQEDGEDGEDHGRASHP